jgi:hypothetical protein
VKYNSDDIDTCIDMADDTGGGGGGGGDEDDDVIHSLLLPCWHKSRKARCRDIKVGLYQLTTHKQTNKQRAANKSKLYHVKSN